MGRGKRKSSRQGIALTLLQVNAGARGLRLPLVCQQLPIRDDILAGARPLGSRRELRSLSSPRLQGSKFGEHRMSWRDSPAGHFCFVLASILSWRIWVYQPQALLGDRVRVTSSTSSKRIRATSPQ